MTSPEIPDSASPYWLRLWGKWIHLNGIMPVNDVKSDRQFSELMTVDGYRYVQAAPRGPRTWELPYRWGTAAATAALESAAYPTPMAGETSRVLFLDTNAAKVNMVDPDLVARWQHSDLTMPFYVINVGESPEDPMWMPSYVAALGDVGDWGIQRIPVRAGVTYTGAFWTVHPNAMDDFLTISTGGVERASAPNIPGGTPDNPSLITVTWTAPADAIAEVAMNINAMAYSAGMMFYEGDCPPDYYRAGRRMPCEVSVQDPSQTINPIWSKRCDPCALPREHSTFVVQEVGYVASDPTMVEA